MKQTVERCREISRPPARRQRAAAEPQAPISLRPQLSTHCTRSQGPLFRPAEPWTASGRLLLLQQPAPAVAAHQGMFKPVPEAEGGLEKDHHHRCLLPPATTAAAARCCHPAAPAPKPHVVFPFDGQEWVVQSLPGFSEAHTVLLCLMSELAKLRTGTPPFMLPAPGASRLRVCVLSHHTSLPCNGPACRLGHGGPAAPPGAHTGRRRWVSGARSSCRRRRRTAC